MVWNSPERNNKQREYLTLLSLSLLCGFALELYFKAWLLASNRRSNDVKAYGHKLNALFADAKKEGLPSVTRLDELVDALARGHEDYTFRYLDEGDKITLINWQYGFLPLDILDTIVDDKVGASASYGLTPGH
jgi:hypothetical protein